VHAQHDQWWSIVTLSFLGVHFGAIPGEPSLLFVRRITGQVIEWFVWESAARLHPLFVTFCLAFRQATD